MKEFNLESTKYINLEGEVWVLPSFVSKLKGKGNGNYNNWINTGSTISLLGKELRLIKNSSLWKEAIQLFKAKYSVIIATSEDVRLIDVDRATAYFNIDKPQHVIHPSLNMNNSYLNLPTPEEPTVTSILFATQLGIEHRAVKQLINKYRMQLESFAPLTFQMSTVEKASGGKWTNKETPNYYNLTEDQCYFLGALSKNTPQVVEFKKWLVTTFSALKKERTLTGPMNELLSYFPGNWEGLVQTLLCHLSSFTEHPFRQEVVLNNKGRVDILMSDKEALEIKNYVINPCHIKDLVVNKAYWYQLKEQFPSFETLYITSTKGITNDALFLTDQLGPEIQYIPLSTMFQRVAPTKELPMYLLTN